MTQALVELRSAVRPHLATVSAGDRILVAVSGGADSLALAGALLAESKDLLITCIGVTIDHQLQDGSDIQARKVVNQLERIGFSEVISQQVNVDQSSGLESGARDARYVALHTIADQRDVVQIYLGHTRDDQAETVLLGLARGSGTRSLSGMAEVNGKYIRPLLAITRAETEATCNEQAIVFWRDPHNVNSEFSRVRVRSEVLPVMEEKIGPGIAAALARSASILRDDADALDAIAGEEIKGCDLASLDCARLEALPRAIRTRVLRAAIYAAGAPSGSITWDHIQGVEALITLWHGQGAVSLPGGVKVERISGRLSLLAQP